MFLVYALLKQPDGRYVLVNRRYKPVGMGTTAHVDYAPSAVKFVRQITQAQAKALSYCGSTDVDAIYLYNDGCVPTDSAAHWKAYAARLERLAGWMVEH